MRSKRKSQFLGIHCSIVRCVVNRSSLDCMHCAWKLRRASFSVPRAECDGCSKGGLPWVCDLLAGVRRGPCSWFIHQPPRAGWFRLSEQRALCSGHLSLPSQCHPPTLHLGLAIVLQLCFAGVGGWLWVMVGRWISAALRERSDQELTLT